ncbi:MAG: molybdopterin-synthase adenylyltransferase MoeB [Myxococcales bacterium]|nr:molybdopterin-synthase adenylyltransferase MoeB [Myxococcales bacterium]
MHQLEQVVPTRVRRHRRRHVVGGVRQVALRHRSQRHRSIQLRGPRRSVVAATHPRPPTPPVTAGHAPGYVLPVPLGPPTPLAPEELARYSRHLLLPELGLEGQRRLKGGSVLCVGTGGLGSPLLLYLAAAGVGRIGLVDFDAVDASNLQRQIAHGTSMVGRPKVESAAARIRDLNPHVRVDTHAEALTSENALRLIEGYDVVVDGSDNFPTRYLVDDACVLLGKPNVYGSVYRFEGQASVFNWQGGPTYRDLFPEPPPPGSVPSCGEAGVLGVVPGLIGTIQAMEALKLLAGFGTTLSGRLLLFDALTTSFSELTLRRDPDRAPVTGLTDYDAFCGVCPAALDPALVRVGAPDLQRRLADGWAPYVLDVREAYEAELAAFPATDRLVPHARVAQIADELPRDRDVLLLCRSGIRSERASATLRGLGFKRLFHLEGGLLAWSRDVDPSVPTY